MLGDPPPLQQLQFFRAVILSAQLLWTPQHCHLHRHQAPERTGHLFLQQSSLATCGRTFDMLVELLSSNISQDVWKQCSCLQLTTQTMYSISHVVSAHPQGRRAREHTRTRCWRKFLLVWLSSESLCKPSLAASYTGDNSTMSSSCLASHNSSVCVCYMCMCMCVHMC